MAHVRPGRQAKEKRYEDAVRRQLAFMKAPDQKTYFKGILEKPYAPAATVLRTHQSLHEFFRQYGE